MMRKRRIFVALPLSPTLQQEILDWERSFSNLPVRWLTPKNLHITIAPPWYASDIPAIQNLLDIAVKDMRTFVVVFKKVLYGPTLRRPRLVWAEGDTPQNLLRVKDALERTLGLKAESRQFLLHLTLARFQPHTFSSFPVKKLDEYIFWEDTVSALALMESHLTRAGADYEILSTHSFPT